MYCTILCILAIILLVYLCKQGENYQLSSGIKVATIQQIVKPGQKPLPSLKCTAGAKGTPGLCK